MKLQKHQLLGQASHRSESCIARFIFLLQRILRYWANMLNNKLGHYIQISKFLTENGPQTFNQLSLFLKNPNKASLKRDLDFLVKNEIITELSRGNITQRYTIAPSGITVLTFFNILPSKETIKTST